MTPDSLTKLFTADSPLTLGRSAHTLRHLAEQLAYQAGRHDVTVADEPIPAQAYADALLDHAIASDRLGYKDTQQRREHLAGIAANYIWKRLRQPHSTPQDETEQSLRQQRQALFRTDIGRLDDRRILELLATHAQLTADIDDLRARRC
jgi:hypothetical protein